MDLTLVYSPSIFLYKTAYPASYGPTVSYSDFLGGGTVYTGSWVPPFEGTYCTSLKGIYYVHIHNHLSTRLYGVETQDTLQKHKFLSRRYAYLAFDRQIFQFNNTIGISEKT
jgi:hypothetical protein